MPSNDGQGRDLVSKPSTPITAGPLGVIPEDLLSTLTDEEKRALVKDYARGAIEIDKKARELHIETGVLKSTLETLAHTTKEVSEAGNAATMTYTQTNKIGRIEAKIGNTDEAKSGRMTSSQTGERNWTPYYIVGGLIAIVLIAFLFAAHH